MWDRLNVILHEPGPIVCSTRPDGLVSALLHQAAAEHALGIMASSVWGLETSLAPLYGTMSFLFLLFVGGMFPISPLPEAWGKHG